MSRDDLYKTKEEKNAYRNGYDDGYADATDFYDSLRLTEPEARKAINDEKIEALEELKAEIDDEYVIEIIDNMIEELRE